MPKSRKRPAKSGTKTRVLKTDHRNGFDPKQTRTPSGLKHKVSRGGKPMLFPGCTGGR